MPRKISPFLQLKVRKRAKYLCEYCHADEHWQFVEFTIDHILPISEGGKDSLENLALACFHCNRYKSNKRAISNIQIFNPRQMVWNEHFIWSKDALRILPKTEIGQATIELLQFNRERVLQIRTDDLKVNRHPPQDDEIED
ncbi:MAG: HNH endonuclease [Pyrinomonadaceae bacterium]|nr:HNH endonuclease [Pyrinomonadaceae bacterium]